MEKVQTKMRRGEGGFTLVELAIVMIIIGLLIAGVLKGQEMIANAQVTSTVAGMKAIDAATSTFRDTFNSMPGDITNANVRLPATCAGLCLGAATGIGDGDGIVDQDPGAALAAGTESGVFFMQLAAVDLISGVDPSAAVFNLDDQAVAETPMDRRTYRVGFVATGGAPTGDVSGGTYRQGHYLAVGGSVTGLEAAGTGSITPIQAARIDNKLDDGNPGTGSMLAGGVAACVAGGEYNGAAVGGAGGADEACEVFYRIQG